MCNPVPEGTRIEYHGSMVQYHGYGKVLKHKGDDDMSSRDGYRYSVLMDKDHLHMFGVRRQSFTIVPDEVG